MVGETFVVEEVDEYGQPWVCKSWPNETEGTCHSHSVALERHEMEIVQGALQSQRCASDLGRDDSLASGSSREAKLQRPLSGDEL